MSFRRRAVLLAGTIALHRFSISSPDLRIDILVLLNKVSRAERRFNVQSVYVVGNPGRAQLQYGLVDVVLGVARRVSLDL